MERLILFVRERQIIHAPSSAFTLIELLIVIGLIAVLSVIVVTVLNPIELLRQARDANRLSDVDTVNKALSLTQIDGIPLGSSSVVYVSLPDPAATTTAGTQCGTMGLPTLPSGSTYHCAASSTFRATDGTGWLPVNLTNFSQGSPLAFLPVDPTNTSSSRLYYSYATNGSGYEVTAALESIKYKLGGSSDVIGPDGGTKASLYEKGTNLALEPLDYGDASLVGYWTFDEGAGTVAYDYSGNNATGTWNGTVNNQWTAGQVGPYAASFNGSDNVYGPTSSILNPQNNQFSFTFWLNPSPSSSERDYMSKFTYQNQGWYAFSYAGEDKLSCGFHGGGSAYIIKTLPFTNGQWSYIACVLNGSKATAYRNGVAEGNLTVGTIGSADVNRIYIGGIADFAGIKSIDDVRIYNRALSAAEIAAMYNGGK